MSHADILDIDRGHIFRKHRRKNNKNVAVIYEKTVRNRPLPGYLPASCHGVRALKVRFPTCVVRTRTNLTRKAYIKRTRIYLARKALRVAARSLTLHDHDDRPTC